MVREADRSKNEAFWAIFPTWYGFSAIITLSIHQIESETFIFGVVSLSDHSFFALNNGFPLSFVLLSMGFGRSGLSEVSKSSFDKKTWHSVERDPKFYTNEIGE